MKNGRLKPASVTKARWAAYATAGAATALGSAASSEGEIHYSGIVNYAFNGSRSWSYATFPLNGSAHLFFLHSTNGLGEGVARFFIPGSHSRLGSSVGRFAGRMAQNSDVYLSRLANRVELSQLTFRNSCYSTYFGDVRCHGATIGRSDAAHGNFKQGGGGFIGFEFDTGGGPQLGWARIKTTGAPDYKFVLVDYAWADYGESIKTGQKSSSQNIEDVARSDSLGLLALGGAGLIAWRERRAAAPGEN